MSKMRDTLLFFLILIQAFGPSAFSLSMHKTPPLPASPVPTAAQLKWQRREITMFMHFGINTFTNSEWGSGHESPTLFNPPSLNASQWFSAAKAAGVTLVILTAKHHDGFCLWPSRYTVHSVANSPWLDGKGDVVREFVDAGRANGIDVGLYLSPWDRHEKTYGLEVQYNEYYMGQLHELLSLYGSISEIWFDGAKGNHTANMTYHFEDWFAMAKQLQGSINIFSNDGPDMRWGGNEIGVANETCWSMINRTSPLLSGPSLWSYTSTGDPKGTDWVPPELDVSIRHGWFWHESENPKSARQLLDIYYTTVGRNGVLLLNVPPNSTGLVSDADIESLKKFRQAIDKIFGKNIARGSNVRASSERGGKHGDFKAKNVLDGDQATYWTPEEDQGKGGYWIELRGLNPTEKFNVVRIEEAIQLGQRIRRHEIFVDGRAVVKNGTTVGHKRLHRLERAVGARRVRIRILDSRGPPLLSEVGLHFDPYKPSTAAS